MDAEDRTFMRELLRRHEKATDAMIRRSDAMIERSDAALRRSDTYFEAMIRRFDEGTDRLREHGRQMEEDHREFVTEMRAQRAALFRILDPLDEGPASAGA